MLNPERLRRTINMPTLIKLECKNCEEEFEVAFKRRTAQFCSKGCATSYRQKAHDPDIFTVSEEFSAYMLGLILTDGCVSEQEGKGRRLTIVNTDLQLMEQIQPLVCPNRKIYKQVKVKEHHAQAYALVNTNEDTLNLLNEWGIKDRKTLTIRIPRFKMEMCRHFIRGVFDGDGSIFKNGDYKHISFTTGSPKFADDLITMLEDFGFTPKRVVDSREHSSSVYVKLYRKAEIEKFYNWVYEDSNWHMERKKQAFEMI